MSNFYSPEHLVLYFDAVSVEMMLFGVPGDFRFRILQTLAAGWLRGVGKAAYVDVENLWMLHKIFECFSTHFHWILLFPLNAVMFLNGNLWWKLSWVVQKSGFEHSLNNESRCFVVMLWRRWLKSLFVFPFLLQYDLIRSQRNVDCEKLKKGHHDKTKKKIGGKCFLVKMKMENCRAKGKISF